jgi:PTS system N-acetylglucosamine-specific IIC component
MTPGSAVFDNLPIIFGIGVAFGFARENRGEVALIGAIAYFALIGLGQNEGGLATLVYGGVHGIGTDGIMSDGTFHSGLLYLNVLDNSGALLSST